MQVSDDEIGTTIYLKCIADVFHPNQHTIRNTCSRDETVYG